MSFEPKSMNDMDLTYEGLCLSTRLQSLRKRAAELEIDLEAKRASARAVERDLESAIGELQARKYHDIGHARCQFECPVIDGKHVALTPEQLDPAVAAHLRTFREILGA